MTLLLDSCLVLPLPSLRYVEVALDLHLIFSSNFFCIFIPSYLVDKTTAYLLDR